LKKTRKPLTDTLLSLEERGLTALGPAMLAAVTIASTQKGSKVVLCTDGNANVGIGSLENIQKRTEIDRVSVESFYKKVGEFAAETGVSISVISIKGTDCSLEYLATVCDQTQGLNDIVDPLQLTTNFSSILENPVIATGVHVRMQLHNGLMFRPSSMKEENTIAESSCILLKTIGNVTAETDCTFEYSSNLANIQSFLGILDALPFQVQIHYTKLNGSKCIRVISKKKAITNNRETAESKVNVAVVGVHAVQQTAKLVQKGLYGKAKMKSLTNTKLLERSAKSDEQKRQVITFRNQSETLEKEISKAKKRERSMGVTSDSDEDDLSDEDKGDIETEKN